MASSRYNSRGLVFNDDDDYREKFFNDRGVKQVVQYDTPFFHYPDMSEMEEFSVSTVRWQSNSRLYNLAAEFYGSATYWWVIAMYNKKPTEGHFKVGDTVYIPKPLDAVLNVMSP